MAILDNSINDRGYGYWEFTIYKPDVDGKVGEGQTKGPYKGVLRVSRDWTYVHSVKGKNPATGELVLEPHGVTFHIASQNVAFIENLRDLRGTAADSGATSE